MRRSSMSPCTSTPALPRDRMAPRVPWWKTLSSIRSTSAGTVRSSMVNVLLFQEKPWIGQIAS